MVAGQRSLGDFKQQVVLPEAERQGNAEDDDADKQPGSQLIEVLDEGEAILVRDRLDAAGHLGASAGLVADDLRVGGVAVNLGRLRLREARRVVVIVVVCRSRR